MGSGSLNAMAVFEANYKDNMDVSIVIRCCCGVFEANYILCGYKLFMIHVNVI